MREMESKRAIIDRKLAETGEIDGIALGEMTACRELLLYTPATSTTDLVIQAASMQALSEFVGLLLKDKPEATSELFENILKKSVIDLHIGLKSLTESLERMSGITASGLGLFEGSGQLN